MKEQARSGFINSSARGDFGVATAYEQTGRILSLTFDPSYNRDKTYKPGRALQSYA